jgi:hypothetical protein
MNRRSSAPSFGSAWRSLRQRVTIVLRRGTTPDALICHRAERSAAPGEERGTAGALAGLVRPAVDRSQGGARGAAENPRPDCLSTPVHGSAEQARLLSHFSGHAVRFIGRCTIWSCILTAVLAIALSSSGFLRAGENNSSNRPTITAVLSIGFLNEIPRSDSLVMGEGRGMRRREFNRDRSFHRTV